MAFQANPNDIMSSKDDEMEKVMKTSIVLLMIHQMVDSLIKNKMLSEEDAAAAKIKLLEQYTIAQDAELKARIHEK